MKMTFTQMLAMSLEDLQKEIAKEERSLLETHMTIRLRQEKDTSKKRKLRLHLARLKTAYTQKLSENFVSSAS